MSRTRFLASVATLAEARQALAGGADIIDLKDPARGALGAVSTDCAHDIVAVVNGQCPISATIGDQPLQPEIIAPAVTAMAATGVDIIKIGWFSSRPVPAVMPVLAEAALRGVQLVMVLFAEYGQQMDYLPALTRAGVYGVMLDTADKTQGGLRDRLAPVELADFVQAARRQGLICGLAGSLAPRDIQPLLALEPDYLGFRGALCRTGDRCAGLDTAAVESIRLLIRAQEKACAHAVNGGECYGAMA